MPNPIARGALRTRLCDRFGIEYPIFAFAHSIEVVAAVTEAGGFGVWGATRNTPEEIADGLAALHARLGGKPFGVDLVLPQGMPELDDREAIEREIPAEHRAFVGDLRTRYGVPEDGQSGMRSRFVRSEQVARRQIEAVLASPVAMFAMGIGSPPETIGRAKATGKTVVSLVGTPKHARRALELGADLLVAQGYDAGAHTGTVGTFSLVPRIVDIAGDVPVLAAGGVATGRHVAASLALGAAGVWTGTAWLATREHAMEPEIVAKLLQADVDSTVISRADSGKTLRQIKTKWSEEWAADDAPAPLRMPYQDILVGDLLGAIDRHRVEPLMHSPAGQSVGYVTGVDSVAEVMSRLVAEWHAALDGLVGDSGEMA
ncbi:nitronate monooxygenase [Saccharopolyspora sp. NPDC050642]|uniref:NAD(P)H-dependent flavin oxidoreductase n=1 Tax=Saccharopolyspora sp. NPDC050642 TaxID=3157099 RepID=UPI0033FD0DAF